MALSLGDINFGLGVDTTSLLRSVSAVVNFGNEVERAAKRTADGAAQAAAALRRQEAAALSALQATLNLNTAIRGAGAPTDLVNRASEAYDRLARSMTQANLSALGFQRAQEAFAATTGTIKRELGEFKNTVDNSATNGARFAEVMRDIASASTLTLGPLSGIGSRVTALTSIINRSNLMIAGFVAGLAGVGAVFGILSSGAVQTALALNIVNQRFEAITGSVAASQVELAHVHDLAERTGISFLTLADSFSRFTAASQGTALSGAQVTQVFDAITTASARFHLSADETSHVMLAVEQMMSKGTVASEELKKQMGNALPGAFRIASDAMGVTQSELMKMLKAGSIASDDFLPKFAVALERAFGVNSQTHVKGLQAELGRLSTATTDFYASFDRVFGASSIYQASIKSLASTLDFLANNMDHLGAVAGAVVGAFAGLFLPELPAAIMAVVGAIRSLTAAMIALDVATVANVFGAIGLILVRVAAAVLGAVAGFKLLDLALSDNIDKYDQFMETNRNFIKSLEDSHKAGSELITEQISKTKEQMASLQGVIDKEKERGKVLEDSYERQKSFAALTGDEAMVHKSQAIQQVVEDMNKHLHQLELYQQDLDKLNKLLAEQAAREREAKNARDEAADSAISKVQDQIARNLALAEAYGKGKKAVSDLQAQFAKVDALNKFNDSIKGLKDRFPDAAKAMQDLSDSIDALNSSQSAAEWAGKLQQMGKIAQETADNFQIAATTVAGSKFGDALRKEFDIRDKVQDTAKQLIDLGLSAGVAQARAEALGRSLQELADAQLQAVQEQAQTSIERLLMLSDATLQGKGAVADLNRQFEEADKIRTFADNLIGAGAAAALNTEQMLRLGEILKHPLDSKDQLAKLVEELQASGNAAAIAAGQILAFMGALGQQDANTASKAVDDITDKIERLNRQIANVNKGKKFIDDLHRSFEFSDTVKETTDRLVGLGVPLAKAAQLANTYAKAMDRWAELGPTIKDNIELYKQWMQIVDQGSKQAADSIAEMVTSSKFDLASLVGTVQKMVQQMLSEFLKMKLIKPLFEEIFGGSGGGGLLGSFISFLSSAITGGMGGVGGGPASGGGRAAGGPVTSGTAYVVGEKGPEVFIPAVSGMIVPNGGNASSSDGSGSNDNGSGRQQVSVHLVVEASDELDARVRAVSSQTASVAVAAYDQKALPQRVATLTRDTWKR